MYLTVLFYDKPVITIHNLIHCHLTPNLSPQSAVGESSTLHQQLITELLGYNDVAEALLWADKFCLDDAVLEATVVEERRLHRSGFSLVCK